MERCAKCPTVETLYRISSALHIPLAELLRFDTEYPENSADARLLKALAGLPPCRRKQLIEAFCAIIAAAETDE